MEKSKLAIIGLSCALVIGVLVPSIIATNYKSELHSKDVAIANMQQQDTKRASDLQNQVNQLAAEKGDLQSKLSLYEKNSPSTGAASSSLSTDAQYYADHFIQIFDVNAQLYDSYTDGTIPGCTFKIKNTGNKTISDLEVTVYYLGKDGQPIGQQDYPIIGTFNDIVSPEYVTLAPNYTYQQTGDQFWSAQSVNKSDWDVGKIKIQIKNLQFQ